MSLIVTLTDVEVAALVASSKTGESAEIVLHRLLAPLVSVTSEKQLQIVADAYRALNPEDQLKVVQVVQDLTSASGSSPVIK